MTFFQYPCNWYYTHSNGQFGYCLNKNLLNVKYLTIIQSEAFIAQCVSYWMTFIFECSCPNF